VAAVRPDSWNLPLLLHVGGAMVLVGALVTALAALLAARRSDAAVLTRLGYRTLLYAALPAFVLMRVGAELIASKEDVPDDVGWIGIGYGISDGGLLLMIIATVLAGLGARRVQRQGAPGGSMTVATALTVLTVVAYVVAVWAMTAKPS
jgi:hypothetical protein